MRTYGSVRGYSQGEKILRGSTRFDPSMNETFQNWADYYGTAFLPAAVRKPRWKPAVENAVKVVTQDILVEMADMTFFSLDELNCELWKRTDKRNRENFKDLDQSRYDKFLGDEKNTLLPLPSQRFEYIQRYTSASSLAKIRIHTEKRSKSGA